MRYSIQSPLWVHTRNRHMWVLSELWLSILTVQNRDLRCCLSRRSLGLKSVEQVPLLCILPSRRTRNSTRNVSSGYCLLTVTSGLIQTSFSYNRDISFCRSVTKANQSVIQPHSYHYARFPFLMRLRTKVYNYDKYEYNRCLASFNSTREFQLLRRYLTVQDICYFAEPWVGIHCIVGLVGWRPHVRYWGDQLCWSTSIPTWLWCLCVFSYSTHHLVQRNSN